MRSLTRSRLLTALLGVGGLTAAVLVVGPGYEAAQVHMRTGTVWLASTQTGEATLVDGASAEVKAHLQIAAAGAALSIVQQGNAALVLNRATGQLSNVDTATEIASAPMEVLPASEGLVALPGPDVLHVADVHSGQIVSVDTPSLTVRHKARQLAGAFKPENVVADGHGRVWALDDDTGDLVWLDNGERRNRGTAAKSVRLTVTNGKPALVDSEHGTVDLLNPATGNVARSLRLGVPTGAVAVGGSADRSRVLIVTDQGELSSCAFGAGCAAPVEVGAAGADLGTPIEVDNHAVVPDYSTGQATIVDLATSRVVAQRQLFDKPTRFELIARDGIVFFNDPAGNTAGVLDLSGDTRTITKYTRAEDDSTAGSDQPVQAEQVAQTGQRKHGLGVTQRDDLPFQPQQPAPVPALSIAVKPGNHGVVGTEFELTARVQSGNGSAAQWSFGDGTEAIGGTVRHSWREPGVFTVRATVSLPGGTQARAETAITVDLPQAPPRINALNLRPARPVIGQSVHFSAETSGSTQSWAWTVSAPGRPSPEIIARTPEFDHSFTTPGIYTVTLTTTANGRSAESSKQLTVSRGAVKLWGGRDDNGDIRDVPGEASSGVVAIAAGDRHALVLKADGTTFTWGNTDNSLMDVPEDARTGVVAIAAGEYHSLVLKPDGSVRSWGLVTDDLQVVPPAALSGVKAIAGGGRHSLALKADGKVIAWGEDDHEQTAVPAAAQSGVKAIAAGDTHSLALKEDGTVLTWGRSDWTNLDIPAEARSGVVAIAAGDDRSVVLKADGTIIAWGHTWEGEAPVPPAVPGAVSLDLGFRHALALKADGSVVGWGSNMNSESEPPDYARNVVAVATGAEFSMVVTD